MTDTDGIATAAADDAAAALAAAAGVAELAAAAEIDAAEGDELLAAFVRHEIALGHQLTMQFAAAGNAALDVALSNAAEDAAAKRADRMAARLGGASARVMGNVRLALLTLAGLPAAAEEQWVGVRFENEAPCSPAEAERRLAAAKAARAAAQGMSVAAEAAAEAGAGARAATAAERERLAAAQAAMAELAVEAGVSALADAAGEGGRIKGLVRHELAAAHRLVMRFGGRAGRLLAHAGADDDRVEALRLASAAARLMARGRQALATLSRLGPGPDGGAGRVAGYYWDGERDMFANSNTSADAHVGAPPSSGVTRGGRPAETAGSPASAHGRPQGAAPTLARRGKLKYGNPSGDYLAAPRCGAKTRAGCSCRQPAMANGRCRFHGGKSTGPRTAAGLASSRASRRTHGGYAAEIIDLRQAAAAHARRVRALAALKCQGSGIRNQGGAASLLVPDPCHPTSAFAGHGVHPLFFMAPPRQRQVG